MQRQLPIGYWIKQADELLTKGIDAIQSSFGITRTDWQLLNLINDRKTVGNDDLLTIMAPFADEQAVGRILARFKADGLVQENEQRSQLTDKGSELHAVCLEKQQSFRQQAMIDISEQDYETTRLTLQRIVDNISPKRD